MAYIGRQLVRGQNRVLDDISSSFNGSTTAFNLTVSSSSSPPASVNQLWIILGGVLQKPGTDFTVADAVITFTTAPASTLSFWGMIQGDTSDINSPADASVTPSKIANSGDFAFPADVRFKDADGSHYVGLQAPSTVSSNLVWSLPAADGSANQVLKTDGSGALGWASDANAPEGTAVLSTGETGTTKYLRVDGDNTCSWQLAVDATKMPLAGGTFTGDVIFTGDAANVTWDKSTDDLIFNDNAKAIFGTSSDGLAVYHDGSNSFISDTGTGLLTIGGSEVRIEGGGDHGETCAKFIDNGAVELYYDNSKKLETDTNGVTITGQCAVTSHVAWPDHSSGYVGKAVFGASDDLQIYHDGSASYIDDTGQGSLIIQSNTVQINNEGGTEVQAKFIENGGVELYHNNLKRLETTTAGAKLSRDTQCDFIIEGDADGFGGGIELHNMSNTNNAHMRIRSIDAAGDDTSEIRFMHDVPPSNSGSIQFWRRPAGGALTEGLRIKSDGGVEIKDGDLIVETAGHGINFHPHSGTANLLDDYEEGSWNASISGAEGGGPTSYSGSGSYIKIGRLVYATIAWSNVTFPALGGQLEISAPFTAGSDAKNPRGGWCYFHPNSAWDDYTDMVGMGARISAGESSFKLDVFLKDDVPTSQSAGSGGRNGNISEASAIYLDFTITYITT